MPRPIHTTGQRKEERPKTALVASVLIVAFTACASTQSRNPNPDAQQSKASGKAAAAGTQPESRAESPSVSPDKPDCEEPPTQTAHYYPTNNQQDPHSAWETISTIVQGVAAAVGIVIGALGLYYGIHGLKAATDAADAAKTSADSEVKALGLARLQQRAWVGVSNIKVANRNAGAPLKFAIEIRNTGQTPALKCAVQTWLQGWRRGEVFVPSYDPKGVQDPSVAVLFPGMSGRTITTSTTVLTEQVLKEVGDGLVVFYVWARIKYTDAFDADHVTDFCARWSGGDEIPSTAENNQAN